MYMQRLAKVENPLQTFFGVAIFRSWSSLSCSYLNSEYLSVNVDHLAVTTVLSVQLSKQSVDVGMEDAAVLELDNSLDEIPKDTDCIYMQS